MFDDIVKHRVELEKLKNGIASKVIKTFAETYPTLKPYLLDISTANQESVIAQIMAQLDQRMGLIQTDLSSQAVDVLKYESQFQAALLAKFSVPGSFQSATVGEGLAQTLVFNSHMAGDLFNDAWRKIDTSLKMEMASKIRLGVVNGLTGNQVAAEVKDKFIAFSDNQLSSLSRTLIQNSVNLGAEETYKSNDIEYIQYCAILDSRTTQICRNLNGKIFKTGEGPRPPQHYNCRSFTIPVDSPDGIKTDATYNDFYERQDAKEGLSSLQKDRFETNQKTSLDTLKNKLGE